MPVRRLALFIEESLYRGTQWVVFEPNDEPLWAQIRLNVGAFMHDLFRQGAFQGTTPREAYFVKCDSETTTQNDIDRGIVNILVGFAPLKPAEFVVIQIQQIAGQIAGLSARRRRWHSSASTPTRFDPYKNFKFRVKWDGRYVAGVSKVSALKRTTEVVEAPRGRRPVSTSRKSPGRTEYEAITLERGVTHDTEFEKWANKVWNFGAGLGAEVSLKDFRKDIIIEVYNEAGQLAIAYKVFRCWVSEFQALPDLDANANAVAIQHIKLENEGWERDYDVDRADASPRSRSRPPEPSDVRARDRRRHAAGRVGARRRRSPRPWRELALLARAVRRGDGRAGAAADRRARPAAAGAAQRGARRSPGLRDRCARCATNASRWRSRRARWRAPPSRAGRRPSSSTTTGACASASRPARTSRPAPGSRPRRRRCWPAACAEATQRDARRAPGELPASLRDALAARMGELDAQADVRIALACPACGHGWEAELDVAGFVLAEVETHATRVLGEIARAGQRVRLDGGRRALA